VPWNMTVQIVLLHYSKNGCSKLVIPKVVIVQSIGRNTRNEILCDEIARANKINANLDIILGLKCVLVLISSSVVPNTNDFLFLPIRENQIYTEFVVS